LSQSRTGRWLRAARRPEIVRRSLRVAALVGTLLVAINYGDRLLRGEITAIDRLKMALTYLVPYGVATFAAVGTLLGDDRIDAGQPLSCAGEANGERRTGRLE
jgi:hypothetical protein